MFNPDRASLALSHSERCVAGSYDCRAEIEGKQVVSGETQLGDGLATEVGRHPSGEVPEPLASLCASMSNARPDITLAQRVPGTKRRNQSLFTKSASDSAMLRHLAIRSAILRPMLDMIGIRTP